MSKAPASPRARAVSSAARRRASRVIGRFRAEPLESRVLLDSTVVFNEIMYNPAGASPDNLEWVEFHNQMAVDMDLSGWSLRGVDYTFPAGTIVRGGGYLVVAASPSALQAASGFVGAKGPFAGRLANEGETLQIVNNNGRVMDEITYGDGRDVHAGWPVGPDGGGVSLAKVDPHGATPPASNWGVSTQIGGTPGARNFAPAGQPIVENLLNQGAAARYQIPTSSTLGTTWTGPAFNDSSWSSGPSGLGFGQISPPIPTTGYWTLNDTASDTSGNNFHGSAVNGPIYSTDRPSSVPSGKSMSFDGINDYFLTGNLTSAFSGSETFSAAMWFKPRAGGQGGVLLTELGQAQPNTEWHDSQIEISPTGEVRVRVWNLPSVSLGNVTFGQWNHVVIRYDGLNDTLDGFLNGIEASSDVAGDRQSPLENGRSQYWAIGAADSTNLGNGRWFDGLVDEFAVWNRALSAQYAQALASGTLPPNLFDDAAPIIAYNYLPGAAGTQEYGGSLGHDFRVNQPITVNQLGVFDSGADGLGRTLTSQIWSRNGTPSRLAELTFSPTAPGTLIGSNRLKPIAGGLVLQPGDYSIVAYGYGPGERNGNEWTGGPTAAFKPTNTGDGRISFTGVSRFGDPGVFPTSPDNYTVAYSAGTFEFGSGFSGLIGTNVRTAMHGVNATAYVRHGFSVANPPGIETLSMRMRYDDGFVAYLNGVEVARRRAPSTLAWNSAASASGASYVDETIDLTAFRGNLLSGNNVLAIQALNASSSDDDFLILPTLSATRSTGGANVVFNEAAAAGAGFFVEIINPAGAAKALGGMQIVNSGGQVYTFPTQSLAAGARLSLTAAQLGFSPSAGQKVFLYAPDRAALLDAIVVDTKLRGRSPEAAGRWLFPTSATPGSANAFSFNNGVVINEIMYNARPTPASPGQFTTTNLVPIGATWKYEQSGADLGTAWRQPGYSDAAWPSGPALHYVEEANLSAPKGTPLTLGRNTYYFRHTFNYSGGGTELSLRPFVDDGAVFYLNGVEIFRYNMPEGPVSYGTLASPGVADAGFTGPFTIPLSALVTGNNVLAVEVHQGSFDSSDVVFGAELAAVTTVVPPVPFTENPEEWVELYNRTGQTIDLSGWRLGDAVDFTFPAGTNLSPDQYLVVSNNAPALRTKFPAARVLGNFSRSLSNTSDNILLLDARGNPADEVLYHDGSPWTAYPDGGGTSLELINPNTDNAAAESWTHSNESSRTAWKTYTYSGVAPATRDPDGYWREFIIGLLDAGEVLLDDITVTDITPGTNNQLLQNTTFNTLDKWRIGGNHKGTVITDPSNPANKVLRLVTVGGAEHYYNHAETTLAGGQSIQPGRTYQISFRARWVAGSNQVNTRLYFNRLPKTTLIDQPALSGTPGARNSRYINNAGPTFKDLKHGPVVPQAGQPVTVSVAAQDPNNVSNATLFWKTDASGWNQLPMTLSAGRYAATVPGQAAGTAVQFYVRATDSLGAAANFPAAGPDSRALYKVNDYGVLTGPMHSFRIMMTGADANWLRDPRNLQSNDWAGATVVYNETEVYYNVGVHLKGSLWGRVGNGYYGLSLRFNSDELFRGVHRSVAFDRSGLSAVGSPGQDEILVRHFINAAGGVPMFNDDLARVVTPHTGDSSPALLQMGRFNDEFLDSQFPDGGDGTTYEFEVISWTTIDTSTPEAPKQFRPGLYYDTDITNLGNDKEAYRHNYGISGNKDKDDFSKMMELAKAFDLTGPALDARTREVIDVDEWMRAFATQSLSGNSDVYTVGAAHNFIFYDRPSDGKVLAFPHDMDASFTRPTNAPLHGSWGNVIKVIQLPGNLRTYYGHLKDLIDNWYNASYMGYWTSHYGSLTGQNYSGILNYIQQRADFVRSQLPAQVPFQITTNGGANFSTPQRSVTINGDGWINVREIFIAGRPEPVEVVWTDTDSWRAVVPLLSGANTLNFRAVDHRGNQVGADSIVVTSTATGPTVAASLRVTEIMYNPTVPAGSAFVGTDFEFIELQNISTQPLPIGGSQFTTGVTFAFPAMTLEPGEHVVIVNNTAAFESRYGTTLNVAGEFTGNLANEGERLVLLGPASEGVLDFTYDDAAPWPTTPDGAGPSLVKIDPLAAATTWNSGSAWRASTLAGGSPGATEASDTTPPMILSWSTAATHASGVGEVGLVVADDNLFVESRSAGVRKVQVRFDRPVDPATFTPSSVQLAGNSQTGALNLSGIAISTSLLESNTLGVINFSAALPNYAKYLVRLSGVAGPGGVALSGDADRVFTALIGDVSGDGRVNATDLSRVRGASTGLVNPFIPAQVRADVSVDGRVNATDLSRVQARNGNDARGILVPTGESSLQSVSQPMLASDEDEDQESEKGNADLLG